MDDEAITELYFQRSEQALTETAAKYGGYCHAIADSILHNAEDDEECVSDTWLGAWNAIPPHRPAILRTFLGKITRRVSLKKRRDSHREKRGGGEVPLVLDELCDCVPDGTDLELQVQAAELQRAVDAFAGGLSVTERRVFLRRYWFFEPVRSIAEGFGFTESKTASMLCRIRKKLRVFLKREGLL